jgi:FkbM family methyltransferase
MAELFESVVAENRRLRHELKVLNARVRAFEASRWWRLHPRFALRRSRPDAASRAQARGARTDAMAPTKVTRLARQWRLRALHERRNAGCGPDEIVLRDGITLRIHPESRPTFDVFCYWSPEGVDELDSFIDGTTDKLRLLDVGASHGVFSLVFAARHPAKEALAVEASPIAFATLLYNVHKNGAKNITAAECALSSDSGTLRMHYYGEYAVAGGGTAEQALPVTSQTGDGLCSAHSFEPDVIKVDVEGHEVRVLQGLRETIERNKPLLFLEVHPAMIHASEGNARIADLVDVLLELGYQAAELRGEVVPVERLSSLDRVERIVLRPDAI